jgi:hypothetical protein
VTSPTRLRLLWSVAALSAAVSAVTLGVVLEKPALPSSRTSALTPIDEYPVDVVVSDQPDLSPSFVEHAVRPLVMLLREKWPGKPQHIRLAIYRSGFPRAYALPRGGTLAAAAFVPGEDIFLLDVQATRTSQLSKFSEAAQLAFVMAHEATHKWQQLRGEDMTSNSVFATRAYAQSPKEREG